MAGMVLHKAAGKGDVAEMRRLAANGGNVNERDADGDSALHIAAGFGHVEAMRVLVVELGADKDAKDAAGSTLHTLSERSGDKVGVLMDRERWNPAPSSRGEQMISQNQLPYPEESNC